MHNTMDHYFLKIQHNTMSQNKRRFKVQERPLKLKGRGTGKEAVQVIKPSASQI